MVDPLTLSRWSHWIMFVAIGVVCLIAVAMPLGLAEPNWPGPQIVFCFAAAWILRRPDFMPVLLLGLVLLASDLLMHRPPGLMAGLFLIIAEFLRARSYASREWPFLVEWGIVAALFLLLLLLNRLLLAVFVVQQPSFGLVAQQLISTVLAYPVVVWASVYLFNVRRISPSSHGGYA